MSGGAGEVGERRTLFCADLNTDAGWAEAAADYDYVLHVASPYPITVPRDENELIMPARDGALRAARDAGVKRLVLAIGYGAKGWTNAFTEKDWTNLNDSSLQPYQNRRRSPSRPLGISSRGRGQAGTGCGQPCRCFRAGSGARLFNLDRAREASLGRRHAGLPRYLLRRCRCPRRRRTAPQDDDPPSCWRRTVSRHRWGFRERS
jgi:hypothetical protein